MAKFSQFSLLFAYTPINTFIWMIYTYTWLAVWCCQEKATTAKSHRDKN